MQLAGTVLEPSPSPDSADHPASDGLLPPLCSPGEPGLDYAGVHTRSLSSVVARSSLLPHLVADLTIEHRGPLLLA